MAALLYFNNVGDIGFSDPLVWKGPIVCGSSTTPIRRNGSPMNTQIGMRGTTNLDYLVGDTTCSWANAYPFPLITTLFPVAPPACRQALHSTSAPAAARHHEPGLSYRDGVRRREW